MISADGCYIFLDGKVGMAEFRRNLIDAEKLFNIKDQIYLMVYIFSYSMSNYATV